MEIGKAIKRTKEGILLDIEVKPNASKSLFPSGYDEWRNRIRVMIKSPAKREKANEKVAEIVAKFFGLDKENASIFSGEKSRKKRILLKQIDKSKVIEKLKNGS